MKIENLALKLQQAKALIDENVIHSAEPGDLHHKIRVVKLHIMELLDQVHPNWESDECAGLEAEKELLKNLDRTLSHLDEQCLKKLPRSESSVPKRAPSICLKPLNTYSFSTLGDFISKYNECWGKLYFASGSSGSLPILEAMHTYLSVVLSLKHSELYSLPTGNFDLKKINECYRAFEVAHSESEFVFKTQDKDEWLGFAERLINGKSALWKRVS